MNPVPFQAVDAEARNLDLNEFPEEVFRSIEIHDFVVAGSASK
jgi:hypothetical protein